MEPLLIHGQRSRYYRLLLLVAGLLGLGIMLAVQQNGGMRFYGWLLIVVQALALPNILRMLRHKGPRVVIDDTGIEDHLLRVGKIPWEDIATAKLQTVRNITLISLQLRDPDKWLNRMSPLRRWGARRNRSMGYSEFNLNLAATDGDPTQVWRLIMQHCGQAAAPAATEAPGTAAASAPAGSFAIRYTPAFSLSSQLRNSLKLSGRGELEFVADGVHLRGKRNVLFGVGSRVDHVFNLRHAANVLRSGKMLHFDIEPPDAPPQSVTLWARDEDMAAKIAAALPSRVTEAAAQAVAEIQDFQSRLAAIGSSAWVTPAIVAANLLVFAAAAYSGAGVMTPNAEVLLKWGTNFAPLTMDGQWWRLFTSMFLHFGLLHVALNMWALAISGRLVERLYGSAYFALIYLVAGLCGSLASLLWNADVNSAGASGAVFGVYGAMLAFFLRKDTRVPASIVRQQRNSGLAFIFYNLMYGFGHHGIDNACHVGGLISGFALGYLMARPLDARHRADAGPRQALLGVLLAAALLGGLGTVAIQKAGRSAPDRQFRRDLVWIGEQEHQALKVFNDSRVEAKQHQLSDEQFAQRIERDVLPPFDAMKQKLDTDQLPPGSKLAPAQDAYRALVENRRTGFRLYVDALRSGNAADFKSANARLGEGQQYIDQLNRLHSAN